MSPTDDLPPPGTPVARYVRAVQTGHRVVVSGHGPLGADGSPQYTGAVGRDLDRLDALEATRLTGRNVVATLAATLGGVEHLRRVRTVESVRFFVVGSDGVDDLAAGLSEVLAELLPNAAIAAPTSIGIASAVFDLPVTVDAVFSLDDERNLT